jgi:hypothetical protein
VKARWESAVRRLLADAGQCIRNRSLSVQDFLNLCFQWVYWGWRIRWVRFCRCFSYCRHLKSMFFLRVRHCLRMAFIKLFYLFFHRVNLFRDEAKVIPDVAGKTATDGLGLADDKGVKFGNGIGDGHNGGVQ